MAVIWFSITYNVYPRSGWLDTIIVEDQGKMFGLSLTNFHCNSQPRMAVDTFNNRSCKACLKRDKDK